MIRVFARLYEGLNRRHLHSLTQAIEHTRTVRTCQFHLCRRAPARNLISLLMRCGVCQPGKRSVKPALIRQKLYVLRGFASDVCFATAIRSLILRRRDFLFINILRRIISFPFEDEPIVQAISRKVWSFLTEFLGVFLFEFEPRSIGSAAKGVWKKKAPLIEKLTRNYWLSPPCWRKDSAMRSRAVGWSESEGDLSRAAIEVRCRIIRRRKLICLRYRAHHAQTSKCSLSFRCSRKPRRRSIDADINGTISWQGRNLRSSRRLSALFVFR